MGSLSKDTVEVANPAAEAAASPTSAAKRPTAGLRQDALSLEVPVKVHGSRVTDVVRGVTPHTEPFEEQTSTMIIFPQGGVLRMSTSVNTGQMLVLTNLKTKQDAICRVVKVRTFSNVQGYVEVEFTHAQPTYWGVHFPGDKSLATSKRLPAAAPAIPAAPAPPAHPEAKSKPTTDVSWPPAQTAPPTPPAVKPPAGDVAKQPTTPATAQPKRFVAPPKPTSTFIGIGSQEEVQPAASATANTRAVPAVDPREVREVAKPVPKETLAPAPAASPTPAAPARSDTASADAAPVGFPSLTMTELLGDAEPRDSSPEAQVARAFEEQSSSQAEKSTTAPSSENSTGAFAGLAAGSATDTGHSAVSETFGSRFDSSARAADLDSATGSPNWMLIAAAIGVLVVVVGGGAFYLRSQRGSAASTTRSAPTVGTAAPPSMAHPADVSAPQVTQPSPAASAAPPVVAAGNVVVAPHGNNVPSVATAKPGTSPSGALAKPSSSSAVVQPVPQPTGVTGNMVAQSLSAHPVTTQHSAEEAVEAPSVDSAPSAADGSGGALPTILSSGEGPVAPEVKSEAPVRVGGNVKEPRLMTSPAPIYPVIAKEAHIQGDVVIKTTIDERGNVAHMEVVSGPPMLRGAAMEALKRWKYSPSMLNGEPITVQMMVTLRFRM